MKDQHTKIVGYRDLSQAEIDLMNRIKASGAELVALHGEVKDLLMRQSAEKVEASMGSRSADSAETAEWNRYCAAEPDRWAAIAKTDIQTGIMALIRAVAQPAV